ncbi:hypothetical protein KM043_003095 [Ampulex compressa]|nr:hypothetical protein KM043_003095 [Ampulex compressa]
MDWPADLEITSKKLIPRLGRRAGQSGLQEDSKSDDDFLDSPLSVSSGKSAGGQVPVAPPRTRKTGWGDDSKSGRAKTSNIIEQERFRGAVQEEQEDDIPVIPDLDEIQEDNVSSEIVNAPVINANRVTAYKELDTDLIKNAAFTSLNGVNLSFLAEKLYNENLIKDPDEVWNWNLLFTQVALEINSESQKKIAP